MGNDEEKTTFAEIKSALSAIRSEEEPNLSDVLLLVNAGYEYETLYVPEAVRDAAVGKWETDRDFANGGMDQFVWNNGIENARWVANAFRAIGAIENADLVDRLANELEDYFKKHPPGKVSEDSVQHFMAYRRNVDGPYFDCPDPGEEIAEALLEFVVAHRQDFADPASLKA